MLAQWGGGKREGRMVVREGAEKGKGEGRGKVIWINKFF